jgi:hypothetical protein
MIGYNQRPLRRLQLGLRLQHAYRSAAPCNFGRGEKSRRRASYNKYFSVVPAGPGSML